MKRLVKPSKVSGAVSAPSSKSMMQRAVAIASLGDRECTITGITPCNDLDASIRAAEALGSRILRDDIAQTLVVTPQAVEQNNTVDCGEAGLSVRMFSPIAALYNKKFNFVGHGSLTTRPLNMIEDAVVKMGAHCSTNKGFLPMTIEGAAAGGNFTIDGSLSSQLLTGLLIALPRCSVDSLLTVNNLTSRPYIDMTVDILSDFGVTIENRNYEQFAISGNQQPERDHYNVEGDWSGASFLMVAAALTGEVTIENLDPHSTQGDKMIAQFVADAGAKVVEHENSYTITPGDLTAFSCDATECPDLFPPLVALAAACKGESFIKGTHRLTHKESDRAKVLIDEFAKIGVTVVERDDTLCVAGGVVTGGFATSSNDHRIAMALAVAALVSEEGVSIENAEAVKKSYPHFFEDIAQLGAEVE